MRGQRDGQHARPSVGPRLARFALAAPPNDQLLLVRIAPQVEGLLRGGRRGQGRETANEHFSFGGLSFDHDHQTSRRKEDAGLEA
jgi:hypothetical protein